MFHSMGYGQWTENNRGSYNIWDAISRSTVQVLRLYGSSFLNDS